MKTETQACTRSIEIDSEPSRPYQTRGFARSNLGKYDKAIDDFNAALDKESDERRQSQILYQRGYAKRFAGQYEEALKDATLALTMDSSNAKTRALKEQLLILLKK
jgi:tetratricopeptide (TPR) repeat protein